MRAPAPSTRENRWHHRCGQQVGEGIAPVPKDTSSVLSSSRCDSDIVRPGIRRASRVLSRPKHYKNKEKCDPNTGREKTRLCGTLSLNTQVPRPAELMYPRKTTTPPLRSLCRYPGKSQFRAESCSRACSTFPKSASACGQSQRRSTCSRLYKGLIYLTL